MLSHRNKWGLGHDPICAQTFRKMILLLQVILSDRGAMCDGSIFATKLLVSAAIVVQKSVVSTWLLHGR